MVPFPSFQRLIHLISKTSDCENSFGISLNHPRPITSVVSTTPSAVGCERPRLLPREISSALSGTIRSANWISSTTYIRYFMLQTSARHPMTHSFLTSSRSSSWFWQSEALWISSTEPTTSKPKNTTNWHVRHCFKVRSSRILLSLRYRLWHVHSLRYGDGMLIFWSGSSS